MSVTAFKTFRVNTKTKVIGVATALFIGVIMSGVLPAAAAVSFNSARDCDANAVIHCGAMSTGELINKYNSNHSAAVIFSWFGIHQGTVHGMGNTAVAGRVTKNGEVIVNNRVVATNAVTAGRRFIPGSTKVVHHGVTFYARAPHVSFRSNSLDAFVVLNKHGQFVHAVLASCGNPVKARNVVPTPKPPVKKPPVKKPPVVKPPVVKPPVVKPPVEKPPVEKPPVEKPEKKPEVKPEKKPEEKPAPAVLPKTGPAALAGYFIGTSALGTVAHWAVARRRKF